MSFNGIICFGAVFVIGYVWYKYLDYNQNEDLRMKMIYLITSVILSGFFIAKVHIDLFTALFGKVAWFYTINDPYELVEIFVDLAVFLLVLLLLNIIWAFVFTTINRYSSQQSSLIVRLLYWQVFYMMIIQGISVYTDLLYSSLEIYARGVSMFDFQPSVMSFMLEMRSYCVIIFKYIALHIIIEGFIYTVPEIIVFLFFPIKRKIRLVIPATTTLVFWYIVGDLPQSWESWVVYSLVFVITEANLWLHYFQYILRKWGW